jgi:hypothetical protein
MKSVIISLAVICVGYCWGSSPVALGPFMFTIPVIGISENSLPALEVAFHEVLGDRNFLHPEVKDGELLFYGGGGGPKALLRLEQVTEAVKLAGFKVDQGLWRLKSQMMGVSLSSKEGAKTSEVIAALKTIEGVSVEDSLLFGDQTYHVIHLERATNYGDLVAIIGKSKLEVDDLLWGHWKYGWEIEEDEHGHGHDMGMTLIRKTASD